MINELDDNLTLTRTYFHAPQGAGRAALGHVDGANPASGAYRYYTHDHLGSTRGVYDQAQDQLARFDYTPYGEIYHAENPGITTRQFTGHDWSPQTGLYFAPYRYYNPAASRWLTRDPLGMADGPNVYAYVMGNPTNTIDVLGLYGYMCTVGWHRVSWPPFVWYGYNCRRLKPDCLDKCNNKHKESVRKCNKDFCEGKKSKAEQGVCLHKAHREKEACYLKCMKWKWI